MKMRMNVSISTNTFAMRIIYLYLASMTLEEMEKQQKEADAVLGASDADNCSYSNGTVKRIIDSQFYLPVMIQVTLQGRHFIHV